MTVASLLELSYASFEPLLRSRFSARVGEATIELELIEVKALGNANAPGLRPPFSLIFSGPPDRSFNQGTYPLTHETLGEHGIFLVPIKRDAKHAQYQAIFA